MLDLMHSLERRHSLVMLILFIIVLLNRAVNASTYCEYLHSQLLCDAYNHCLWFDMGFVGGFCLDLHPDPYD